MNNAINTRPQLYFNKIGNWGSSDYPYPEATFDELQSELLKGGSLSTFIYVERAVANLVACALKEGKYKDILVVLPTKFRRDKFKKELIKSINELKINDQIAKTSEEYVILSESRCCNFVACNMASLRGMSADVIYLTEWKSNIDFIFQVIFPILISNNKCELYNVTATIDDPETAKRRLLYQIEDCEPWHYASLMLFKIDLENFRTYFTK